MATRLFSDLYYIDSVTSGSVAATAGSGIRLLPGDVNRKAFYIFNDSPATLFVKIGTSGSTQDYTFQLPPLSLYESTRRCSATRPSPPRAASR